MCGRYTLFTPAEELASRFDATFAEPPEPRYNCAPGQSLPVITNDDPDRFQQFKWGLIPSWADDEGLGNDLINARAETLAEKPSFEAAYQRRRCLIPADGFYEWVQEDDAKQPYRVAFADDRPFAMAGLWERWEPSHTQTGLGDFGGGSSAESDGDDAVESFTIVTTEPNDVVADLHHRMAVVLDRDEEETWLHGDVEEAADLLDPYPADEWEAYPVSTRVNSPANDAAELIEPV